MKRLLIVTYYWPPSAGSGVQRWLKFAKCLPQFGWQPVIYTPANPDFDLQDDALLNDIPKEAEIIKTKIWEPYSIAKIFSGNKKNVGQVKSSQNQSKKTKLLNYIRGNYFIPDPRVFWVKPSTKYLKQYLTENPVDAIVTTGPPHSMHLIGLEIKKLFPALKWIVDIRDPWSKLDFLDTYGITKKNRLKYAKQEREVLAACDQIIGTSFSMHTMLEPFDHSKYHTITNGYDQDDFKDFEYHYQKKDDTYTIFHAGLLNELRNPENLWIALSQYCAEHPSFKKRLKIHLVGNVSDQVHQRLKQDIHLSSCILIEGYKTHKEVLQLYAESDLLLCLINNTDNSKVNIPGKLFELMATKKPVLGIGRAGDDGLELLKKYGFYKTVYYLDSININELIRPKNKQHLFDSLCTGIAFSRSQLTKDLVTRLL